MSMTGFVTKKFLSISAAVLLLVASTVLILGTGYDQCPPRLAGIDSLMNSNPQAAYDSLLHIDSLHIYKGDKAAEMRMRMLKVKAQNKLFMQLPSDSSFMEVVSYYDRHGSANDRMLSHYLLGCIYRDKEDCESTIRNYQNAICCADTTDNNCDYRLLSSIYSQMARAYAVGSLPKYARNSYFKGVWYSMKIGDIKNAIIDMEALAYLDYITGDTVNAINDAIKVEKLYRVKGYSVESFSVYPIYIYTHLNRGQYSKAHNLMMKYRRNSGNFDAKGDLKPGREHYYKALGLYFLGVNNNDSAEYYFRKLQQSGFDYEGARGLCDMYAAMGCHDSVNKYNALCEAEMDSIIKDTHDNKLLQGDEQYDFARIQRLMDENERKRGMIIIMVFFSPVLLFVTLVIIRFGKPIVTNILSTQLNTKRQTNIAQVIPNLQISSSENDDENLRNEVSILKEEYDKLLAIQKKKETNDQIIKIKKSDVYCKFVKSSKPTIDKIIILEEDWLALEKQIEEAFPVLFSTLKSNMKLTTVEYYVCLLTAIGFQTLEISTILNSKKQKISNIKNIANYKIYGSHGAKQLFFNMKDEMM